VIGGINGYAALATWTDQEFSRLQVREYKGQLIPFLATTADNYGHFVKRKFFRNGLE
jgi:hypothetical protein